MSYEVTIAIPVYNVEKYVERSLLSALNQSFESIEYLIIDDKGTDKSIEIVKGVIKKHPRGEHVRIVDHVVNKGTGATKNSAIKEAKGRYLFFMDSDDTIHPKCISKLYDIAEKYQVEIVASSHDTCDERGKIICLNRQKQHFVEGESLIDYFGNKIFLVYTWNKLYNLKYLRDNNIRCIPHHLCEDVFFTFQIICTCKSFYIYNGVTYHYLQNPNSLMGNQKNGFTEKLSVMYVEAIVEKCKYIKNISDKDSLSILCDSIVKEIKFLRNNIVSSSLIDNNKKKELINSLYELLPYVLEYGSFFKQTNVPKKNCVYWVKKIRRRLIICYLNLLRLLTYQLFTRLLVNLKKL